MGTNASGERERDERLIDLRRDVPEGYRALAAVTRSAGILGDGLDELVKVRASMVNGCAYCIDTHVARAVKDGEDPRRLHALAAWRDSLVFSERERAALTLTDAMTEISGAADLQPALEAAGAHFPGEELGRLAMAIIAINAWNRAAIASGLRPPPLGAG